MSSWPNMIGEYDTRSQWPTLWASARGWPHAKTPDGSVCTQQETLQSLKQVHHETCRHRVGAWCLVLAYHQCHGILEVLQGIILSQPPFIGNPTNNVGLESQQGVVVDPPRHPRTETCVARMKLKVHQFLLHISSGLGRPSTPLAFRLEVFPNCFRFSIKGSSHHRSGAARQPLLYISPERPTSFHEDGFVGVNRPCR